MHIVDTNVVSEFMRPKPDRAVLEWADTIERFSLSVVTVEEVLFGLALKKSVRLERWFESFLNEYCEVLPVTVSIARRCAALRADLRQAGRIRTQAGMLIAATASEHDLVIVTRNARDFGGCGVRVLNPFSD